MGGVATALEELTLVLFSTLAPAGVCACVVISLAAVWGVSDTAERARLQHMCAVPLFLAMAGLVMSATHLGTPTNALYVVDGIGRSPLSNEVATCVLFMGSSGMFWLYSFSLEPSALLQKAWTVANAVLGGICLASISLAYNSPTILTWSTPFVPLSVWLEAGAGGPLLAFLVLRASSAELANVVERGTRVAGFICFAASVVVLTAQYIHVLTLESEVVSAASLIPGYPIVLLLYSIAGTTAYWITDSQVSSVSSPCIPALPHAVAELAESKLTWSVVASALFLIGLFAVRFCFYMMHLTYGIGF